MSRRILRSALLAAVAAGGCASGCADPHADPQAASAEDLTGSTATHTGDGTDLNSHLNSTAQEVRGNQGTPFASEDNLASAGRFQEVMQVVMWNNGSAAGCTGTVVAPHAVLTANHCIPQGWVGGEIRWNDDVLSVDGVELNPYLTSAYTPQWWKDADAARNDGRLDDWPAQHDHAMLFVPDLTPEFMRTRGIRPAGLEATDPGEDYTLVGTGASGGYHRDSLVNDFESVSVAGRIDVGNRDGYLTRENDAYGYGTATPGDSGGPTFGSDIHAWADGRQVEGARTVMGTAQNPSDLSPLAYVPGMTVNQRLTVRLNNLWARAARGDADGDGLPLPCDPDPTSAAALGNLCPPEIGTARRMDRPVGQLECRPGFVVAGVRGQQGWLVDRLGVLCRATSCYAGGACESYWTDELGGAGGGDFSWVCPDDTVATQLSGRHQAGQGVNSVRLGCAPADWIRDGMANITVLSPEYGNDWGRLRNGALYTRRCGAGGALTGLQVRSHDNRTITGVQPICEDDFGVTTPYTGGAGGGGALLECPEGTVGYGMVGRESETAAGAVVTGMVGLICAPEATILARQQPTGDELVVVHSSHWDENRLGFYPSRVLPYRAFRATRPIDKGDADEEFEDDYAEARCAVGTAITDVYARAGALVDRLYSFRCEQFGAGAASSNYGSLSLGSYGGAYAPHRCPDARFADGLFVRDGALLDGLAVRCGAQP